MKKLIIGQTYFGPDDERRTVVGLRRGKVETLRPLSLERETITAAEMEEFVAGSTRRTYRDPKGEVRIKIEQTDDEVTYVTPDYKRFTIARKKWDKWRAAVKA